MVPDPSLLQLAGHHPGRRIGREILVSRRSESTNRDARQLLADRGSAGQHGVVLTTLEQYQGVGTRGRSWWSPPDDSLAVSVILVPESPLERPAVLTLIAALAVLRAGRPYRGDLRVKWPNDVVDVEGRKLCGILAETPVSQPPAHVVGIGVNLNRPTDQVMPAELSAGFLNQDPAGPDRPRLLPRRFLGELLSALEQELDRFVAEGSKAVTAAFNQASWLAGRTVRLRRGAELVEGRFVGVDAALRVTLIDRQGQPVSWPGEQLELVDRPQ